MTNIEEVGPEYIEERRKEIVAALDAEGITEEKIDEMDPDDVLDVIAEALIKHEVPERSAALDGDN